MTYSVPFTDQSLSCCRDLAKGNVDNKILALAIGNGQGRATALKHTPVTFSLSLSLPDHTTIA